MPKLVRWDPVFVAIRSELHQIRIPKHSFVGHVLCILSASGHLVVWIHFLEHLTKPGQYLQHISGKRSLKHFWTKQEKTFFFNKG